MKVTLRRGLKGYSGELDGAVYYYHSRLGRTLMRRKPKNVRLGAQHETLKTVTRKLMDLNPSQGYRSDLRTYLGILRDQDGPQSSLSWVNIYYRLMWAMGKMMPDLDLANLTREQIISEDLPCRSVKRAVEAGLLVPVNGYEYLNRDI